MEKTKKTTGTAIPKELVDAIGTESMMYFIGCDNAGQESLDITASDIIESFNGFVDEMRYISGMSYLAKAVSFYMMYSSDHVELKKKVQDVFESVLDNNEAYKDNYECLHILRYAIDDFINQKNK